MMTSALSIVRSLPGPDLPFSPGAAVEAAGFDAVVVFVLVEG
jgi:hypothetical protein